MKIVKQKVCVKKCCKCGKRIHGGYAHTIYCPHCSRFAVRMAAKKFSPEIVKQLWDDVRQHEGFFCHYTGMRLDMDDPHSPWYCVFDHWHPRDAKRIVLTSSLFNEMKSNLTEDEFWYIIKQLAHHRRLGKHVRKIRLSCWPGHVMPSDETGKRLKQYLLREHKGSGCCALCGKRVFVYNAKYCPRCAKFVARLHSKGLPPETIEETLEYVRQKHFTCFYSGIQLDLDDPKSPWYCVLDHWIPQDPGKIVLTCDLFNVMKSDLSEKEFWYYVLQLADYIEKGRPVRKMKLAYFWRLCPVEDV